MKILSNNWRLGDIIIIVLSYTLLINIPHYLGFTFCFLPMVISRIYLGQKLKNKLDLEEVVVFGIERKKFRVRLFISIITAIILIIAFYYLTLSGYAEWKHWILLAFLLALTVESAIPTLHWTVIIEKNTVYVRKNFTKPFDLSKNMTLKKITAKKIEVRYKDWSTELAITSSEVTQLQELINNATE